MKLSTTAAPARGFHDLGVNGNLADALSHLGITDPFPIQTATLPDSLAGRDVLGRGRTGSGKTLTSFKAAQLARGLAEIDKVRSAVKSPRPMKRLFVEPWMNYSHGHKAKKC